MPDYPGLDPNTPNTQHPPPSRPPTPPTLGRTPRRPRGRRVLAGVPCGLPGFGEKVPSVLVAWKVIIPHTSLLQASPRRRRALFSPLLLFVPLLHLTAFGVPGMWFRFWPCQGAMRTAQVPWTCLAVTQLCRAPAPPGWAGAMRIGPDGAGRGVGQGTGQGLGLWLV